MKRQFNSLLILLFFFFLTIEKTNAQEPNWLWAKATGGLSEDIGHSATIDDFGNIYTTGNFTGTSDFDPGPGIFDMTAVGGDDIFILKLKNAGNFDWVKTIGGISSDGAYLITSDDSGNVYITGFFGDTVDFDPGPGIFNLLSAGSSDIFICKLDSDGNFIWAKSLGGSLNDVGTSIAIDAFGNKDIYTTGSFKGTADFDPSSGIFNLTSVGFSDIFISKLNSSGNLAWARSIGGTVNDHGVSVAVDPSANGDVYIAGSFGSTVDFDPGPGLFNLTSAGYSDIFICKLDSSGNFIWAKRIGGINDETILSISFDPINSNLYTTGYFESTVDFDPGPGTSYLTSVQQQDIFISKFDSAGNLIWAKGMGGVAEDVGTSIVHDPVDNGVYITGYFSYTVDFNPGPGTFNLDAVSPYPSDIFVSKLDLDGNFVWAKSAGGFSDDEGWSVAVNSTGDLFVAGRFRSDTINFGSTTLINVDAADTIGIPSDIFIAKLGFSTCNSDFYLVPDTLILHHYWAINLALGNGSLTYLWSWGDGTYDSIAYPSHIYADSGFYTICLTIEDSTGCVDSMCIDYNIQKISRENTIVKVDVVDSIPSIPTAIENTNVLQSWSVFPNPASGNSFINYTLSTSATVSIALYDVLGNKLQQLVNGNKEQGEHNATIDARKLANGVYVLQIQAGEQVAEEKIVVMK
ncbi:MAG TPA: T9SS type A sorting domain-containing protein [Chitinophagales bacterium]|nr:T9SS type A sorting domain-containing protein [Chitinophagales bacterium]